MHSSSRKKSPPGSGARAKRKARTGSAGVMLIRIIGRVPRRRELTFLSVPGHSILFDEFGVTGDADWEGRA